jgi:hypothetical protein
MKTPDKFDHYDLLKYVRFADGTVKFCNVGEEHRSLCDESDKSAVVSAGTIAVKLWRIEDYDYGSMTLKVSSSHDDREVIGKVLEPYGYQYKDPRE